MAKRFANAPGRLPSLTSLYQRIVRLTAEQHVAGEDAEIPAGHLATSAGIARKTSAGAARSTERDFLWALDQAPNQSKTANRATQITAANPKLDMVPVLAGLAVTWWFSQLMTKLLFGVPPLDPVSIGAATLILIAGAAVAAWLPAHRASRVSPTTALRYE